MDNPSPTPAGSKAIPWQEIKNIVKNRESKKFLKEETPQLPRQRGMGRGKLLEYVRATFGNHAAEARLREELRSCKTLLDYSNETIEKRYNYGMPCSDGANDSDRSPPAEEPSDGRDSPFTEMMKKCAIKPPPQNVAQNGHQPSQSPSYWTKNDPEKPSESPELPAQPITPRLFSPDTKLKYRNALVQNFTQKNGYSPKNDDFPALK